MGPLPSEEEADRMLDEVVQIASSIIEAIAVKIADSIGGMEPYDGEVVLKTDLRIPKSEIFLCFQPEEARHYFAT